MNTSVLAVVAAAHVEALHVAPAVVPVDAPPGVGEKGDTVLGWLRWAGYMAVVAGIVLVGIRVAVGNKRGEGEENMKGLGYVIIAGIVISAASLIAEAVTS